jgi:hypothetical protein
MDRTLGKAASSSQLAKSKLPENNIQTGNFETLDPD